MSDMSDDSFSLPSDDDFEADVISKPAQKTKSTDKAKTRTKSKTASKRPLERPQNPPTSKKTRDMPIENAIVGPPLNSIATTKGPPVASAAEARNLIKSYMTAQNRPYSVIQVFDNLHHRVTKPDVQRALDELTSPPPRGCLRVKDYGKARIYFVDQTTVGSQEDKKIDFDAEITHLTAQLNEFKGEEDGLRSECVMLAAQPADSDLDEKLDALERELQDKKSRLQSLGRQEKVNPQDRTRAVEEFNFYRNAWRTRKEKSMSLVHMLAEGMEKSVRETMALIGVETDEEEGVACPATLR